MFARSVSIALLALPILASAAVSRRGGSGDINYSCNTGSLNCCNSVQQSNDLNKHTTDLFKSLNIDVSQLTGQVGVTCSSITVIGTSGTSCNAQPTCCTNNSFNGVVAVGCSPVNVNV